MLPAPVKPIVPFEVFEKLDIRVGTILQVTDVVRSKKLVVLTVDFGDHERSIVVGLKQERENPAEIEGSQALFVMNLPEKTIAGVLSQGMLFDIGYGDGIKPCLAVPESSVPNGSRAG